MPLKDSRVVPKISVNGFQLYYEDRGKGQETIVFSHGLLWNSSQFSSLLAAFEDRFRVIAWDHRGQGQSESPDEPLHSLEACYEDTLALLETLNPGPVHFVGSTMGGFVGIRLAARHPEWVRSLTLLATAADPEPFFDKPKFQMMNIVGRWLGFGPLVGAIMPIVLGRSFMRDSKRKEERANCRAQLLANRPTIHRAVQGVIERKDATPLLVDVRCPTLVVHGEEDQAISRARVLALCEGLPNARFVSVPKAGNALTIEVPEVVESELKTFIAEIKVASGT